MRGYDYNGIFRGIKSADNYGTIGTLNWDDNWVSYMDTMLQFEIIGASTRELYLPTRLQKAIINPKKHLKMIEDLTEGTTLPVHWYKNIKVMKSGGVELRGVKTSLAPRRQQAQSAPKLEKYNFTLYDNQSKEGTKVEALSPLLQIALENTNMLKMKILENVIDKPAESLLCPLVMDILESEPVMRTDITVATSLPSATFTPILEPLSIKIVNKDIKTTVPDQNCHLVMGVDVLSRHGKDVLKNMMDSLIVGGMVLLEETINVLANPEHKNMLESLQLNVIAVQKSTTNTYILLRKPIEVPNNTTIINVTEKNFSWVEDLKKAMEQSEKEGQTIFVVCQGEETTGVVGMVNCLKQESGGNKIRLYFLQDKKCEKFSTTTEFFRKQIKKDLVMNVYKDGNWGSYRHVILEQVEDVPTLQVK